MANNENQTPAARARGGRFAARGGRGPATAQTRKVSAYPGIELLTRGKNTNLLSWKKRVADLLQSEYGDLGLFVDTGRYFVPDEIEVDEDRLAEDENGFYWEEIKSMKAERTKLVFNMKKNHTACFATIRSLLTTEVEEAVKLATGYEKAQRDRCPLSLLKISETAAQSDGTDRNPAIVALEARKRYHELRMFPFESTPGYYERFTFALEQMESTNARRLPGPANDAGEHETEPYNTPVQSAMDFMHGLNSNYADFVTSVLNNSTLGAAVIPETVEAMYSAANAFVVKVPKASSGSGAMFAVISGGRGRGDGGRGRGRGRGRVSSSQEAGHDHRASAPNAPPAAAAAATAPEPGEWEDHRRCWICEEVGHVQRHCPMREGGYANCIVAAVKSGRLSVDAVILDSGASTSRFDNDHLLVDVETDNSLPPVTAFGGRVVRSTESGLLPGFIRVGICRGCGVNALSLHELEQLFVVEYQQGVSYTVYSDAGAVEFRKDEFGLYSANFGEENAHVYAAMADAADGPLPPMVLACHGERDVPPGNGDENDELPLLIDKNSHDSDAPPPLVDDDSSDEDSSDNGDDDHPPLLVYDDSSDDDDELLTPGGGDQGSNDDYDDMPALADDDSDEDDDDEEVPALIGGTVGSLLVATTVAELRSQYTKRELDEADEAWSFVCRGNLSFEAAVGLATRSSDIHGCNIRKESIVRAFKIHGADLAAVRGATRRSAPTVRAHLGETDAIEDQELHVDVMFVRKKAFLLSVAWPLDLTLITAVQSETADAIGEAISGHVAALAQHRAAVKAVYADRGGAMLGLSARLSASGIKVGLCGAGDHVGRAENRIKTVKEKLRTLINRLPFELPEALLGDAASYVVKRVNCETTSSRAGHRCPRVELTGIKIDYQSEYAVGFGDYVEARDPAAKSNNVDSRRTNSCIALWPVGNREGSWRLFTLGTCEQVTRSQLKVMPTPQVVIDRMNQICEEEKRKAGLAKPGRRHAQPADSIGDATVGDEATAEITANQTQSDGGVPGASNLCGADDAQRAERDSRHAMESVAAPANSEEVGSDSAELELAPDNIVTAEMTSAYQSAGSASNAVARRSARAANGLRLPERYQLNHLTVAAARRAHGAMADSAISEELLQLVKMKAFTPVPRHTAKGRPIRSSMFLKEKLDPKGVFVRLKARLVANGAQQDRSTFDDLSSPTVGMPAFFAMLTLAASERRKASVFDVGSAYLNAEMEGDEVVMELDQLLSTILAKLAPEFASFVDQRGKLCVRLDRALYGCVQSAILWYKKLISVLTAAGYELNSQEPCVLNKSIDGHQATILLFVDDIMLLCAAEGAADELESVLKTAFGDIKRLDGTELPFLGMSISFKPDGTVEVSMSGYVRDLLAQGGVEGAAASPANALLFEVSEDDVLLCESDRKSFHTMVAKLLYLSKRTRPDIQVAISFLCTRVTKATVRDKIKLERVLKYLLATKERVLLLGHHKPSSIVTDKKITLCAYVDASFGVHCDGKSHTGLIITLGRGAIVSKSSKQRIVTKSSTEAELVALSDSLGEIIWMREFLVAQGYDVGAVRVFEDNMATIALCNKGGPSHRTKHVKIRNFFIKERIEEGVVELVFCPTDEQLADVLTKPLQGDLFRYFRAALGGESEGSVDALTRVVPIAAFLHALRGLDNDVDSLSAGSVLY